MHFYQKHNVGYKGKKAQKTLYMCLCIWYIGDKGMKQVVIKGVRYPIECVDDEISLAHQLAREGYTIREIAQILNVPERRVKKYMEDCW
jgi:hypothetical protein